MPSTIHAARILARFILVLIAMSLILIAILQISMTRSLPIVSGEREVASLEAPVRVERDNLGVAVIHAEIREDAFLAQGYVHAQERYPQMDLARRFIAGRLAELVGPIVAETDLDQRRYDFNRVTREILESMPADHRRMIESYTQGVNAGLADTRSPHPVYLALRHDPQPWTPEDCVRMALFMHTTLAFGEMSERMVNVMDESLPPQLVRFLTPHVTVHDAPVIGDRSVELPALPDSLTRVSSARNRANVAFPPEYGSNNWVVGPSMTEDGRAIVANDMHLGLSVPNTWHRAEIRTPELTLVGVSLPGVPGVVVGTNTRVSWGFTNVMGDFQDLIRLRINPENENEYLTPDGYVPFETREETVRIRGGETRTRTMHATRWGPVVDDLHDGTPCALAWPALDAETNNLNFLAMFDVETTDEALDVIEGWFGPPQNVVVADREGDIGWTLSGYLPKRRGFDGKRSADWSKPGVGWLPGEQQPRPRLTNPESGFITTANARTIPLDRAEELGHNWGNPVRQRRIARLLKESGAFDETDMLRIQLDTDVSSTFETYRRAFLDAIPKDEGAPALARARGIVASWNGRADLDQTGITILDLFRSRLHRTLIGALTAPCDELAPEFTYRWFQSDEVIRRLLVEKPSIMLPENHDTWEGFLRETATSVVEDLGVASKTDGELAWGKSNGAGISHLLSYAAPQLGPLLNAPDNNLPGHSRAVRVQGFSFGASQRLVVSPGRERDAILHMPTGQVMHPISRHRMDMHKDWVRGEATPLLATSRLNRLRLVPGGGE